MGGLQADRQSKFQGAAQRTSPQARKSSFNGVTVALLLGGCCTTCPHTVTPRSATPHTAPHSCPSRPCALRGLRPRTRGKGAILGCTTPPAAPTVVPDGRPFPAGVPAASEVFMTVDPCPFRVSHGYPQTNWQAKRLQVYGDAGLHSSGGAFASGMFPQKVRQMQQAGFTFDVFLGQTLFLVMYWALPSWCFLRENDFVTKKSNFRVAKQ